MKKFLFFVLSVFFASYSYSQTSLDLKTFREKALADMIYNRVNQIRDSLNLPPLKRDSILELAAKNQSQYLKKTENTVHTQEDPNFATLDLRVEYYKGTHEKLAENVDLVYIDKPFTIYKEKNTIKINSYEGATYAFIKATLNATSSFVNLANKEFYTTGIGFSIDEEKKALYITQVFGSSPYYFPASLKSKENKKNYYPSKKASIDNAFGIKQGTDKTCSKCIADFNKTPDYVEKKLVIENGKIYFLFGDLELFNQMYADGTVSFSADIVANSQFPCGQGNIIHRSFAFDGIMLKPVGTKDLVKRNTQAGENKLYALLGDIPKELASQELICNLLLIKENQLCQYYVEFAPIKSKRSLINTEVFVDTVLKSEITKSKNLYFTIPFEKDKSTYSEKDIKPFYDSLQLNKFNIKSATVMAYSSVEGSSERNAELARQRAESIVKVFQSYQLDTIKKIIKSQENWDQFYRDIKNTPYAFLSSLDKAQIKEKLQVDSIAKALEPMLKRQRKAVLYLKIVEKIDLDKDKNTLITHFIKAMSKKDIATATTLQTSIFDAISNGELSYEAVELVQLPKSKEFAQMINNDIIFRYSIGRKFDYIKELTEATNLEPSNVYIKYNLYDLTLKRWNDSLIAPSSTDALLKNIKALYNTKIDKKLVHKLYLNYQILITGFFLETKKYKYREDAVGLVKKYYKSIDENQEDQFSVAKYFVTNNRPEWALEILFPVMQKGEYTEDMLFYFLSIAIPRSDLFEKKEFEAYFLKAKNLDRQKFCKLFGEDKLNFYLLRLEQLKEYYCGTCN